MSSKKKNNIVDYFAPYKFDLFKVLVSLVITSSLILGLGKAIEFLVDRGFVAGNVLVLKEAVIIIIIAIITISIATYLRSSLVNWIAENIVQEIRTKIFCNLVKQPPSFFETSPVSEILSKVSSNTMLLRTTISTIVAFALRNLMTLIGGIILLLITSPMLTLKVLVIFPLVLLPIAFLAKIVKKHNKIVEQNLSGLYVNFHDALFGIKTVQSYNLQEILGKSYEASVLDTKEKALARIRIRALFISLFIFSVFSTITIVLWLGGLDVVEGKRSAGELTSFIFYSILVAASSLGIAEAYADVKKAKVAFDELFELMNVTPAILDIPNAKELNIVKSITFDNISFKYPSRDIHALKGFSLTINKGEKIAIIGHSGSGKSTLFALLERFYEVSNGEILINNIDIKSYNIESLRSKIALVDQDPFIFSASAYDNILYGNPSASSDEVINAAKSAEIYDFFDNLPEKMNMHLGEQGTKLSGGQKQRIAIARAILKNAEILLLDEATSSLDAENEKLVQTALDKLMLGRTTIMITHKLSNVTKADKIVVLNSGMIEAIGTHDELLNISPTYIKFLSIQTNS